MYDTPFSNRFLVIFLAILAAIGVFGGRAHAAPSSDRITVSVSPQEGFLHQNALQDTLGIDRPESSCTAFNN